VPRPNGVSETTGGLPPHPPLFTRGRFARLLALFALAVVATVISFAIVSRISGPRLLPGGTAAAAISADASTGEHVTAFATGAPPTRPVVVEFFETTCAVCRQEVAPMCQVKAQHPGVDFYGIDAARENAATVNDFRRTQANGCTDWPLLLDPRSDLLRAYSVSVVPTVYVIDTRGRIAYAGTGAGGVDGLATALRNLGANG
jgi:thiol-disulfide isomerase/thioredoxin